MNYYQVEKNEEDIYILEDKPDPKYTLKTESILTQCNGYVGIRASFETRMLKEARGMYVAGFYHKAGSYEVSELVNCPDLIGMDLWINDEEFCLETCKIKEFTRKLNVRTGELTVKIKFDLVNTKDIEFISRRFVSMKNPHLICHTINMNTGTDIQLQIVTGINGQITNSGVSHFDKVENRVFEKKYMYTKNFCNDDQVFEAMTVCMADVEQNPVFQLKRRSIYGKYLFHLQEGKQFSFSKYSYIYAGTVMKQSNIETMFDILGQCERAGYEQLLNEQIQTYRDFWKYAAVSIDGVTPEEEAAIAFSQYHLLGMVPYDTTEYSVAAKGLTGEGYKGHVFWDTEMFVMPFFTAVFPEVAKNIVEFRYRGLEGARLKAEQYHYQGAMYPWEVAKTGAEETPLYAALNIYTGEAEKVWSGIKEHHITADIIHAMWDYYKLTKDEELLDSCGYEMLIETAAFWCSRAAYHHGNNRYEILDIIGPDEYTEHIDNNAYTNYMAHENVSLAFDIISDLKEHSADVYQRLRKNYDLEHMLITWENFLKYIYLPQPNVSGIIPQDDTFLTKKEILNIDLYKNSTVKQSVLQNYSREEVVNMQVLKQADVVMLLNLMPYLFDKETISKNVRYYESRTIHDSSLSYTAHAIASSNIGDIQSAYQFFKKALEIDLNDNYNDSIDGIHSAALGGIWNCIVHGFAGVRYSLDYVEISPHLPEAWNKLQFYLKVKGYYIRITINNSKVILKPENPLREELQFLINGKLHKMNGFIEINLNETVN